MELWKIEQNVLEEGAFLRGIANVASKFSNSIKGPEAGLTPEQDGLKKEFDLYYQKTEKTLASIVRLGASWTPFSWDRQEQVQKASLDLSKVAKTGILASSSPETEIAKVLFESPVDIAGAADNLAGSVKSGVKSVTNAVSGVVKSAFQTTAISTALKDINNVFAQMKKSGYVGGFPGGKFTRIDKNLKIEIKFNFGTKQKTWIEMAKAMGVDAGPDLKNHESRVGKTPSEIIKHLQDGDFSVDDLNLSELSSVSNALKVTLPSSFTSGNPGPEDVEEARQNISSKLPGETNQKALEGKDTKEIIALVKRKRVVEKQLALMKTQKLTNIVTALKLTPKSTVPQELARQIVVSLGVSQESEAKDPKERIGMSGRQLIDLIQSNNIKLEDLDIAELKVVAQEVGVKSSLPGNPSNDAVDEFRKKIYLELPTSVTQNQLKSLAPESILIQVQDGRINAKQLQALDADKLRLVVKAMNATPISSDPVQLANQIVKSTEFSRTDRVKQLMDPAWRKKNLSDGSGLINGQKTWSLLTKMPDIKFNEVASRLSREEAKIVFGQDTAPLRQKFTGGKHSRAAYAKTGAELVRDKVISIQDATQDELVFLIFQLAGERPVSYNNIEELRKQAEGAIVKIEQMKKKRLSKEEAPKASKQNEPEAQPGAQSDPNDKRKNDYENIKKEIQSVNSNDAFLKTLEKNDPRLNEITQKVMDKLGGWSKTFNMTRGDFRKAFNDELQKVIQTYNQ